MGPGSGCRTTLICHELFTAGAAAAFHKHFPRGRFDPSALVSVRDFEHLPHGVLIFGEPHLVLLTADLITLDS